ncbi:MAG TPA: hypothetical protein DET40_18715 [Lentisphaeria bacterium]|nr:MAG: hypothetical protein A2X45_25650 [Lentisphaerae bacterium GWF2_50_93]HCE45578.1 hypothetical protein [Lentisphaeria bacterium]
MAYEVDNKACPSNLEVLVLTGYLGRKSLTCPLARVKIVGFSIQDFRYFNHYAKNTGVSDYLYFKPLYSTTIDGKSEKNILCLDCLKNHQGATDDVNVLYNDGALGANGTKTVHGTISTLKIKDLPPEIIKQIQYSAQPPTDPLN